MEKQQRINQILRELDDIRSQQKKLGSFNKFETKEEQIRYAKNTDLVSLELKLMKELKELENSK